MDPSAARRSNLVPMKPGPRADLITDAQLKVRIATLQQELQQANFQIQNLLQILDKGKQAFENMKMRGENMAIHTAALLAEKHNGVTTVSPEMLDSFELAMRQGQFGGFDFKLVGPDAVGPRRVLMKYLTLADMAKLGHDEVGARPQGIAAPTAEEEAAIPNPCPGPWHKSMNAPGAACPKCGLAFPQRDE